VERHEFTGTLQDSGTGGGRWIEVPFDAKEVFGQARPPVRGTVNGTPLRTRLAAYGGRTYLGLRAEIRAAAGIDVGDSFAVELAVDTEPREVVVPDDLAAALAQDPAAGEAFATMSFTHRREYVRWVEEAKRPETRARRVAGTVERVGSGERGGPR
jgi:Bacteriocin-protection, YdeI or OmpD-Associated/Domain of unknown function (DUF1905)